MIKMNKKIIETYAIQFSQLCHMVVLAFLIPILIGVEEYGKYAAMYAIPGFFQGMIETFVMLMLMKSILNKPFLKVFFSIVVVAIVMIFTISFFLFQLKEVFLILTLFCCLIFRATLISGVYNNTEVSINKIIIGELLTLLTYVLIIFACYFFYIRSYLLPLFTVCGGAVFSGIYFLRFLRIGTKDNIEKIKTKEVVRSLLARTYEDSLLTLTPILIINVFNAKIAGEFRIITSIIKGMLKLFPYKYELIVRYVKEGSFRIESLIKFSIIFIFFGILLYGGVNLFSVLFELNFSHWLFYLIILGGVIVTLLVVYPISVIYLGKLPFITLGAFVLMYSITFYTKKIEFFILSAYIVNISLYLYVILNLKKKLIVK